jgi:hypothetical protein
MMSKFKKDDVVTFTGEAKVSRVADDGSITGMFVNGEYYTTLTDWVTFELKSRPFEEGKLYQDSAGSVWLRTAGIGMPRGGFWQNVTRASLVIARINPDESTLRMMIPED